MEEKEFETLGATAKKRSSGYKMCSALKANRQRD